MATKSLIDILCNQLRDELLKEGATLEEMLAELRQLREGEPPSFDEEGDHLQKAKKEGDRDV